MSRCCGMCANWAQFSLRMPMAGACSLHGVRKRYRREAPGCFASVAEWVPRPEFHLWLLMLGDRCLGRVQGSDCSPRCWWCTDRFEPWTECATLAEAARAVVEACRR